MVRRSVPLLLAFATFLALPASAFAVTGTLTASPATPGTGDPVTFTATASGVGPFTYEFIEDDNSVQSGSSNVYTGGPYAAGAHHIQATITAAGEGGATTSTNAVCLDVGQVTLAPAIAQSTIYVVKGDPTTFSVSAPGVAAPANYTWTVDGASAAPDDFITQNTMTRAFATTGAHTIEVQVADGVHCSQTVTKTVDVLIGPPLSGTITASPEFPSKLAATTLTATPLGGKGAITIDWDTYFFGGDGRTPDFLSSHGPTASFSMPDYDHVVVFARFTDSVGQTYVASRTIYRWRDFVAGLSYAVYPQQPSGAVAGEPEVRDDVHFTATASDGIDPVTQTFQVAGEAPETKTGSWVYFDRLFTTAGTKHVTLTTTDSQGRVSTASRDIRVDERLTPDLVVETEKPTDASKRTVDASATGTDGGRAPLKYAFDWGSDGSYEQSGNSRLYTRTVDKSVLPTTLTLKVTDAIGRVRTIKRQVKVDCTKEASFELVEITTDGCMINKGTERSPRWETTDTVRVNGMTIDPPSGKTFVAWGPDDDHPGGRIAVDGVSIKLAGKTLWRGDIGWDMPAGTGQDSVGEGTVARLTIPDEVQLLGLPVEGSFALKIGHTAGGRYYWSFPLQFGLPSIFKSKKGAEGTEGGVSAEGAVKLDEGGVHYDGLRLQLADVWVGAVLVKSLCLSYVPGDGQSVESCQPPTLDGKPYLTCNAVVSDDRWDASALVELPGTGNMRIGAFGGIAHSSTSTYLSSLGGYVDNARIPLVYGVYLARLGFGFCKGPPLKLRGDVGLSILPVGNSELVQVNGYFIYTDPWQGDPWSVEVGGSVELKDFQVGSGFVTIRPTGLIDFGATAAIRIPREKTKVSLEGGISGWVDVPSRQFTVTGNIKGCLTDLDLCAEAKALLSSKAVAGCIDVGWGIAGGFGYYWVKPYDGDQFNLFGGCDLSPYEATRPSAYKAQAGTRTITLPAEKAAAIRVHGTPGAAPKVTLHGPDGTVIASAPDKDAATVASKWILVEDDTTGTTSVFVRAPAAGRWTIEGAGITRVETADYFGPSKASGSVRRVAGRKYRASIKWTAPEGTKATLVEISGKVQRTIATGLKGGSAALNFNAVDGPGGKRRLRVILERSDGMPGGVFTVATYTAPARIRPGTPKALYAERRANGVVLVRWSKAARAERYSMQVVTSGGKRFPVVPRKGCTVIKLRGISATERVRISVNGMRGLEMIQGKAATATLKARQKRSRKKAPKRIGTICETR